MRTMLLLLVALLPCGLSLGLETSESSPPPGLPPQESPPQESKVVNSIGMPLIVLNPGEFVMGSPVSEKRRRSDETLRPVRLGKTILMGAKPVTQDEYFQVTGLRPSWFSESGLGRRFVEGMDVRNFPVELVSWDAAQSFCTRLSALPGERSAGRRYRLPTEAEFEYAARAGSATSMPLGGGLSSTAANFNGEFPYGEAERGPYVARTTKVDAHPPNRLGFFDLQGNVWQWCSDWYSAETSHATLDPAGPATGTMRVIRGCGWNAFGMHCRLAARDKREPTSRLSFIGFRVVAETGVE